MKYRSICRICGKSSPQAKAKKGVYQTCPHCKASGTFLFDAAEPIKRAKPKPPVKKTVAEKVKSAVKPKSKKEV